MMMASSQYAAGPMGLLQEGPVAGLEPLVFVETEVEAWCLLWVWRLICHDGQMLLL